MDLPIPINTYVMYVRMCVHSVCVHVQMYVHTCMSAYCNSKRFSFEVFYKCVTLYSMICLHVQCLSANELKTYIPYFMNGTIAQSVIKAIVSLNFRP